MSAGHTPGSWLVDTIDDCERFSLPRGPIHQVLATVRGYPSTVCTVEEYAEVPGFDANRLADARLIAAAPDLLDALTMVRDADNDCRRDGLPTIPHPARAKIDAAINKATGESL